MRDFYKKKPDLQVASEIMRILRELVTGVAHLHSLNIGMFICACDNNANAP